MSGPLHDHPDEFKANWGQLLQRKEKFQCDPLTPVNTKLSIAEAQPKPLPWLRGEATRASEIEAAQAQDLGWGALTAALLPTGDQLGEHAAHPHAGEAQRRGPRPHH